MKARKPPCRCDLWPFPHRRCEACEELEAEATAEAEEEFWTDHRERQRDCETMRRSGY